MFVQNTVIRMLTLLMAIAGLGLVVTHAALQAGCTPKGETSGGPAALQAPRALLRQDDGGVVPLPRFFPATKAAPVFLGKPHDGPASGR